MADSDRDLALIGMACRFPSAPTPEAFWANLAGGVESVREVPPDRWPLDRYYNPTPGTPGTSASKWGAFLDDLWGFDAAFFGIEPEEAEVMDPQHRVLLELAQEAFERGGYPAGRRAPLRTGVFVGIAQGRYQEHLLQRMLAGQAVHPTGLANTLRNLSAGRIAHQFDLNGPALAVDTACSSALVALHLARQSLLTGECDLALVGGVNLNLGPSPFIAFTNAGVLNPEGRTYVFDERAGGMVLGEGAGVVLMTPLRRALEQGDPILGVVKGSAVNNDGHAMSPMTPRPQGQQAVLEAAYRAAGLDPATVSYLEAHSTGTRIGDVVEARTLTRFFGPAPEGQARRLGSVKANIGHLLGAAGMASLVKVLLCLQHRQVPPAVTSGRPRSSLDLHRSGFDLNQELVPWTGSRPLRAGINGFGFGGTNAHVILEAPPAPPDPGSTGAPLWMLTASTETALRRSAADLAAYIEHHPEAAPGDVCYSTRTARTPAAWRAALVGHEDITARLRALAHGAGSPRTYTGLAPFGVPRIVFRFAGFDAWAFGQAGQLLCELPAFREAVGRIAPKPALVTTLEEAAEGPVPPGTAFPAWVAGQAALAQMLREWGIQPATVTGEGPGALAALAFAGALATEAALAAAAAWGCLLEAGEEPDAAGLLDRLGLPPLRTQSIPILSQASGDGRDTWLAVPASPGPAEALDTFDAVVMLGAGPDKSTNGRAPLPLLLPLFEPGTPALERLYEAVGRLWVGGAPVDPFALGAAPRHCRVSVPTYPFERTPHRVYPPAPPPAVEAAEPTPETRKNDVSGWLHEVVWEASPLPRPGTTSLARWVLVPAAVPAARRLADHLHEELEFHGYACEQVTPGGLPAALTGGPCGVVFVGPVGPPPPLDTLDALMRGQERGALALHTVGRALQAAPPAHRPRGVWVLTEGAFHVGGGDAHRAPERAMLAGLALALPDEIAGLDGRVVDLDPALGTEQQLGAVLEELEAEPGCGLVAWRGGQRWSRHLRALPARPLPEPPAYRGDGVYLITGGATGLGAEVARSLAAHGATTLALVGRTPAGRDPRRTALVQDLRRAGATVAYRAADVTQPEAVTALVDDLVGRHGRIAGVVHAAGIARAGSLAGKTRAQVAAVLAPKVRGTWLLARALCHAGQQVDFFTCFSSISAVVPGLGGGLSDYVAANAFLDAFARAEREQGRAVTSINWSIWSEAGLGANPLLLKNLADRGIHGISTEDGVRAFHLALAYGTGQVAVLNHAPGAGAAPAAALGGAARTGTRPAAPRSAPARPAAPAHEETPPDTPSAADIERLIQSLLAVKLDTPPEAVAVEVPFVALGVDSLDALDLVADLEKTKGWSLPETLFFEYQTIRELARFLSTYPASGALEDPPVPEATAGASPS